MDINNMSLQMLESLNVLKHNLVKRQTRQRIYNTRAIYKVRGLILLLRVGTCGGAVTVSFPKYFPWQAMHFLQSSTHFSKTYCRPCRGLQEYSGTGSFDLGAPFSWLKKPRNRMGRDLDCMVDVLMGFHRSIFPSRTQNPIQISPHAISGLFQPWKGTSEARNFQVINGLQHVFEKWVERCKKHIACQGKYFEKETSHLTSTKFRLEVISWVHELFKWLSYLAIPSLLHGHWKEI
jgi:hypothetical protein